jgi:hypothetical protein
MATSVCVAVYSLLDCDVGDVGVPCVTDVVD